MGRVDLNVLLFRVFASPLRRNVGDRAFEHLQERLLHPFAGNVARDRDVLTRLADLVDLVDIDDSALSQFDVKICGAEQLQNQVLDVFADVTRFGERRRVPNCERHVERFRKGLRQERLSASRGAQQKDVRLPQLDVVDIGKRTDSFIMVVYGDGKGLLRVVLTDDVVVQFLQQLARSGRFGKSAPFADSSSTFLT